jgi:ribokinase
VSADVVVVGSFMVDLVIRAPRRPLAGETLVGHSLEQFFGGKGCNQAVAAARAGASVAMVGRVGADDYGRQFLGLLEREGIDATHVSVDADEGTGIGAPLVEDSGDNSIVIVPRANRRNTPADLEAARTLLAGACVVLLQLELPIDVVAAAARTAHAGGATVVLNPAPAVSIEQLRPFEGVVDLLVPNEGEATLLTGIDGDPLAAAKALQERFGTPIAVTLGEQGSLVLAADGDHEELPAHPVEVVDTVGAGDAYCGALGARLAAGDELRAAARAAGAAGSLAVTRAGAEPSLPTAAEVAALLSPGGSRSTCGSPRPRP